MDAPAKLTDAWADWVVARITANGLPALTDADIAAIVNTPTTALRAAVVALLASGDEEALATARAYADGIAQTVSDSVRGRIGTGDIQAVNTAKAYSDARDAEVLSAAKAYTDSHSSTGGVSKTYVDTQDTAVQAAASMALSGAMTSAMAYADNAADAVLADSKGYTDSKVGAFVSRETLETELTESGVELRAYTDDTSNATLTAAKLYTDNNSGGGNTEYVDSEIANARVDLRTYTNGEISNLHAAVTNEQNDAIETAANGLALYTDAAITTQTQYVDERDAATLAAAVQYVVDHPGGGASSAYVDQGDSNTAAAGRAYADTGDTASLSAAKTYADAKKIEAQTYADNKDTTALAAAKSYADAAVSSGPWKSPTLNSGFTGDLQYRLTTNGIQWKGQLTRTAGNFPANTNTDVMTLAAEARPLSYTRKALWLYGAVFAGLQISTVGIVTITSGAVASDTIYFSDLAYAR